MTALGDDATEQNQRTANTWANTLIGQKETVKTSKAALAVARDQDHKTAERWKAIVTAERAAHLQDVVRARKLLEDLTKEIAPLARNEIDARNALAKAVAEKAARLAASTELGVNANATTGQAATGARAVLAAALVAKTSVEEQQKFHDARQQWALDNLTPVK